MTDAFDRLVYIYGLGWVVGRIRYYVTYFAFDSASKVYLYHLFSFSFSNSLNFTETTFITYKVKCSDFLKIFLRIWRINFVRIFNFMLKLVLKCAFCVDCCWNLQDIYTGFGCVFKLHTIINKQFKHVITVV